MKNLRQDAWTEEDDRVLAEIILRHIAGGSTQLAAFEECSERLGRTAAACGYRWNASVRKTYKSGITIAKTQRKQLKSLQKKGNRNRSYPFFQSEEEHQSRVTWDEVLKFLKECKLEQHELTHQLEHLQKQNLELSEELHNITKKYEQIKEDHKNMILIFEKARKLALINGNLSHVEQK